MGSVGDAYDNAISESFVDTFKTELIKDRVWHSNQQLELAIVEWVAWFNNDRLHSALRNRPPAEIEAEWSLQNGVLEEPDPLRPRPTFWLMKRSQLVSLPERLNHHKPPENLQTQPPSKSGHFTRRGGVGRGRWRGGV
jgi:hypothetical protein